MILTATLPEGPSERAATIKKLFTDGQYGNIFSTETKQPGITFAATNKYIDHTPGDPEIDIYRDFSAGRFSADAAVTVRFDVQPINGSSKYDNVDAYIIDATTGQQRGKLTSVPVKDGLFVSIPMSIISQYATNSYTSGPDTDIKEGTFKIKLVARFSSQANAQEYPSYTRSFRVLHAKHTAETPLGGCRSFNATSFKFAPSGRNGLSEETLLPRRRK
jgi:hypothetical protein